MWSSWNLNLVKQNKKVVQIFSSLSSIIVKDHMEISKTREHAWHNKYSKKNYKNTLRNISDACSHLFEQITSNLQS